MIHLWNKFIKRLVDKNVNIHSILLGRGEEILFKQSAKEVDGSALHRQFSISKSFTSLAIACLAEEGKLSLDDAIITFYPEYAAKVSSVMSNVTIREMLKMESPHSSTTYKKDGVSSWVGSYFTTDISQMPNSTFSYDTSSPHVLAHLVERLSGMRILDYLRSRGLASVGFSDEAYFLLDPQESPLGGSGLMATLEDIFIFASTIMQNGRFKSKQIFPSDYCRLATTRQTSTQFHAKLPELAFGYGYQIWRHRAGWFLYGMGGQFAICVPEHQLILVTNADTQKMPCQEQAIFDAFFEEIIEQYSGEKVYENVTESYEHELYLPVAKAEKPLAATSKVLQNANFFYKHSSEDIRLEIQEISSTKLQFSVSSGDEVILNLNLLADMQNEMYLLKNKFRTLASFAEIGVDRYYVLMQVIDIEIGFVELEVQVLEEAVQIRIKNNIERFFHGFNGIYYFS